MIDARCASSPCSGHADGDEPRLPSTLRCTALRSLATSAEGLADISPFSFKRRWFKVRWMTWGASTIRQDLPPSRAACCRRSPRDARRRWMTPARVRPRQALPPGGARLATQQMQMNHSGVPAARARREQHVRYPQARASHMPPRFVIRPQRSLASWSSSSVLRRHPLQVPAVSQKNAI
jgi:hypothetical protein